VRLRHGRYEGNSVHSPTRVDEYPAEHLDCQCPDQLNPSHLRAAGLILSPEEVEELIASAKNLMHRAMLMTLYATGFRRSELCQLKVTHIDSQRIVIRVRQGKGSQDRDVLLSSMRVMVCLNHARSTTGGISGRKIPMF